MKISEQLQMVRTWRKLSQQELAKRVNTRRETIVHIENENTNPNKDLLAKLSEVLNYHFVVGDEG